MDTLTLRRRRLPNLPPICYFALICVLWLMPSSSSAQVGTGGPVVGMDAYAYESITVATVAIGFTASLLSPTNQPSAKAAIVTVEPTASSDFRYLYHGADPTTTEGHLVTIATPTERMFTVVGINNLTRFRAIRTGGTSAVLKVTYVR